MTTVVFQPHGGLQNLQIGGADIVALLGAAHSVWGWIGGLDGVKNILDRAGAVVCGTTRQPRLSLSIPIPHANYLILTSQGPISWEDGQRAFGGDPAMQVVGATLCALAHECGSFAAVKVFMRCLAPTLWKEEFRQIPGLREAIRLQLMDNIQAILNDGATRGFTQRFVQAVAESGLPRGDMEWLKTYTQVSDDLAALPTELELVGGLLCWILRQDNVSQAYCTRSGMVARTAVYLRAIGYPLDSVRIWNGLGPQPRVIRGVILVTGGTSQTDPLRLDPGEFAEGHRQFYYRHSTVGAMLINAIGFPTNLAPETAQVMFCSVEETIKETIELRWRASRDGLHRLEAIFTTSDYTTSRRHRSQASPHALSLASVYFPLSAQLLAPCYNYIATDRIRRCAVKHKANIAAFEDLPEDLILFRVVTAEIIIAVVGLFGGEEYWSISHASSGCLDDESWLEYMASVLDKGLNNSIPMAEAVTLVASIHSAADSDGEFSSNTIAKIDRNLIGARNGIFGVVPSLFFNMTPGPQCIGLRCVDKFLGNVPVHPDGWIKSGTTAAVHFYGPEEASVSTAFDIAVRGPQHNALLGSPVIAPPDIPLYISIERVQHYSRPDVMLAGRINGELVGTVSIEDTLWVVCRSLEAANDCTGNCTESTMVLNMPASKWISEHVLHPDFPVCLQVDGDAAWRLFAAGQARQCSGLLMFGCFLCAVKAIEMSEVPHKDGGGSVVVAGRTLMQ
jgi:hypothetical protein